MNGRGSAQESIAVTPKINHITSLLSHRWFLGHGRTPAGCVCARGEPGGAAGRGRGGRGEQPSGPYPRRCPGPGPRASGGPAKGGPRRPGAASRARRGPAPRGSPGPWSPSRGAVPALRRLGGAAPPRARAWERARSFCAFVLGASEPGSLSASGSKKK